MISFETRYDEAIARWQYRAPGGEWSKPVRFMKLAVMLQHEVAEVPEVPEAERKWSRPVDHKPRVRRTMDEQHLYEISGGKVQRIASSAKERSEQQVAELAELMGLLP
jgi:hypothetical protein